MSILEEEAKLDLHGVPGTAVDDLPLAGVALGVALQELHHLSPDGLKDAQGVPHIQKHLCHQGKTGQQRPMSFSQQPMVFQQ